MASPLKHPRNVVGPAVARLRIKGALSQAELAGRCQRSGWDVSRSVIASIEGRARWVGDFEVVILAKLLGVAPADLLPDKVAWDELKLRDFSPRR